MLDRNLLLEITDIGYEMDFPTIVRQTDYQVAWVLFFLGRRSGSVVIYSLRDIYEMFGYSETGRRLGVSDNAIRKHLRKQKINL